LGGQEQAGDCREEEDVVEDELDAWLRTSLLIRQKEKKGCINNLRS
jgi:hypothetical protein